MIISNQPRLDISFTCNQFFEVFPESLQSQIETATVFSFKTDTGVPAERGNESFQCSILHQIKDTAAIQKLLITGTLDKPTTRRPDGSGGCL